MHNGTFSLKIEGMENESFTEDARAETIRIIRRVADRLESEDGGTCRDINGNSVGTWDYDAPESEG